MYASCNALRRQMQSFAWTDAKLCVSGCKALRERMQSFALAHAMLCVGRCNALRLRWAELPHKNGDEAVSKVTDTASLLFFSFHVFLFRILGLHTEQRIFRGLIEFLEKMRQVLP